MNFNIRKIQWSVILARPEARVAFISGLAVSLIVLLLAGILYALIALIVGVAAFGLLAYLLRRKVGRRRWLTKHRQFVEVAKRGNVDVLFLGDSLMAGWRDKGAGIWERHFESLRVANFGIGGDRTHEVLWRLRDGELDGILPKVVVLMAGTNNISCGESPQHIADSIAGILSEIRTRLPKTKILLLGIFPRGKGRNLLRDKIEQANAFISKLSDGNKIIFMDVGASFMDSNKRISGEIMFDYLHLTRKGYEIWARSIKGQVVRLLNS